MQTWFDLCNFCYSFEEDTLTKWRNYELLRKALDAKVISDEECEELTYDLLDLQSENKDFGKFLDAHFSEIPTRPKIQEICNLRLKHFNDELGCNIQILEYYFDVRDYFNDTGRVKISFESSDLEAVLRYIDENDLDTSFKEHCEYVTTSYIDYIATKSAKDVEENQCLKMRLVCEFLNDIIFDCNCSYFDDLNELVYR